MYTGILHDGFGSVVAVKCITHDSKQGEREFLAKISIISQTRHHDLVQLQGWCQEEDKLLLVYEYTPALNGSERPEGASMGPASTGVAAAIAYLHE